MTQFDHWIERLARRVRWGEFLHRAANWLAVYLLLVGGLVLAGKLLVPRTDWPGLVGGEYRAAVAWLLLACVAGGVVPVAITWWRSRRSRMTRTDLVAWLDGRLEAGGLLMTLCETSDQPAADGTCWSASLPEAESAWRICLPRVRPRRFTRHLFVPVVFLVIACMIPWRVALSSTLRDTVGQRETEQLVELLEELKQAGVLEEQEQEQLEEEIQHLAEDTRRVPLTHEKWETVDTLRERMQMKLDSASLSVEKALEAIESLKVAEFDEKGEPVDGEHGEQLREDIEEAVRKLTQGKSPGELPESLKNLAEKLQRQQQGADGKQRSLDLPSDAGERQQALQDLQEFLQQESQQLEQLRQQAQRNPGGT
ncbi:MAG: hypothetical protein VB859_08315 [Planctomycetaceae bacterium]